MKRNLKLSDAMRKRLQNYKLDDYIRDVEKHGLEKTWARICQYVVENQGNTLDFLSIDNFGELYEIGLATQDKILKKKSGQYYTPDDVAQVMSEWFEGCEGEAVCDVACGTGKLILTYLERIGYERARELISSGNLYLYDFDKVALGICKTSISIKYGLDIADQIHDVYGDFLKKSVRLPENCKVIANPPYAHISEKGKGWEQTAVLKDTAELYSVFMEKIFRQAKSTVIITPFGFISGARFYTLRKQMCELGNGFVVSFDNVPGNIFCGRKHGIFNTNTANSVRAAITVLRQDEEKKGFRISPLIRFKNEQRGALLVCEVLEKMLAEEYQTVTEGDPCFKKIENKLQGIYRDWVEKSQYKLNQFLIIEKNVEFEEGGTHFIDMPNTCRYYTTGSTRKLRRKGSIGLYVEEPEAYDFIYCMINSSFTYWWWRIFDGGITYPLGLLQEMPLPYNLLNEDDKKFFREMREKLSAEQDAYIVTKMNAGAVQENIKFPKEYRDLINERILKMLGHERSGEIFDNVHENYFKLEG